MSVTKVVQYLAYTPYSSTPRACSSMVSYWIADASSPSCWRARACLCHVAWVICEYWMQTESDLNTEKSVEYTVYPMFNTFLRMRKCMELFWGLWIWCSEILHEDTAMRVLILAFGKLQISSQQSLNFQKRKQAAFNIIESLCYKNFA